MNRQSVGYLMLAALGASALLTLWLSVRYFFSVRELQGIQAQYLQVNNTRNAVQALANEAVEYSKRNPAIDSILREFDLKAKLGPTNSQPTAKPSVGP